jgi:hypothetical protein
MEGRRGILTYGLVVVLGLATVAGSKPVSKKPADPLQYKPRGKGASLRNEGRKKMLVSGGPKLISFIAHPASAVELGRSRNLRVRFYLPAPGSAYITALEPGPDKSYFMRPKRDKWNSGWSEFSWSADEVARKMKVKFANIGVVVRQNDHDGVGTVYPALFGGGTWPPKISEYTVSIYSKYTCTPVRWELRDSKRARIDTGAVERLPAFAARSFKLKQFDKKRPDGWYHLKLTWNRSGKGKKHDSTYKFYHRSKTE